MRQFITTAWKRLADNTVRQAAAQIARMLEALARDLDATLTRLERERETATGEAVPSDEVIPAGATMMYTGAACPTGWTALNDTTHASDMSNRFPVGGNQTLASDFYRGNDLGNSNHSHEFPLVFAASTTSTVTVTAGTGAMIAVDDHTHEFNPISSSHFTMPPFINVLFCQKD